MSLTVIILLSTLLILGSTYFITYLINYRSKTTSEDWSIGGRNLPTYVIIGTQFASAAGGGVLVALVGLGYKAGLSTMTYGIIVVIPFIILTFLAKWLRTNKFSTIPDIFAHIYGEHKGIALVSALLTLIVPFGWITAQLVAFGKLYSAITGLESAYLMMIITGISLVFVMPSGLKTVAWTDFFFACFMLVICFIVTMGALDMAGGWAHVLTRVPEQNVALPGGFFSVGGFTVLLWFFSALPGGVTNQIYYQRISAIKNPNQVRISLIGAAIALIASIVWAFMMGCIIRSLNPGLESEMATGWLLTQLPIWLLALFAGLIVATIISTTSSACQTVVLNITRDIYLKLMVDEPEEKKLIVLSRLLSVAVMVIACSMSIWFPETLKWLVYTYAFSAAGLLAPIFLGYIYRDRGFITQNAVLSSMIVGIVVCIFTKQFSTIIPFAVWGILGSFITIYLVSMVEGTKKEKLEERKVR
ncbi:MAG: sodium:solute symporter family protein [Desulfobacteraceae bacterium]|nr:sodium:solute symporter family protein [Desulfobacteraceae bacterium]